jgi:hypothetical protein
MVYTPETFMTTKIETVSNNIPVPQFYIHGSVHRNSILIRSNKMKQNEGIYLLSRVVSSPFNNKFSYTCRSHLPKLIWPLWRKAVAQIL